MRNQTVINLSSKSDQFKNASLQLGERRQIPPCTDTGQRNAIEGLQQGFSRRAGRRLFGQPLGQASNLLTALGQLAPRLVLDQAQHSQPDQQYAHQARYSSRPPLLPSAA